MQPATDPRARHHPRVRLLLLAALGSSLLAPTVHAAAPSPTPPDASRPASTPAPATPTASPLDALLQQALVLEEARRDLESAIAAYEQVVRGVDDQRRLAATAIFRLGECYRKTGRTNDAVGQFQRVLRDFSAEEVLTRLSRQNLAALGAKPLPPPEIPALGPAPEGRAAGGATSTAVTASAATPAGRERQLALLDEELNLLERQLVTARLRLGQGIDSQAEIWSLEREILQLKRQRVGLQDSPTPPAADTQDSEVVRLVRQIAEFQQRSPTDPASLTLFLEAFPDPELADVRKRLKDAEQKLSSLQGNPDDNASEISSTESEISRLKSRRRARWDAVLMDQQARVQAMGPAMAGVGARPDAGVMSAADAAEIARLQALISQSPDLLNAPTGDPAMAPLHRAAAAGQLAVVRFLASQGANLDNPRSPQGWTPLHQAAARGHKAVVELLLASGAAANAPAADASRPLHLAVTREYFEVARALIAGGAEVDARGWSAGGVYRPVQRGPSTSYERDSAHTALHLAARQGLTNLVTLLLDARANPNATNSFGQTPLHVAVDARQLAVIPQLLKAGASPDRQDLAGNSPLHFALGNQSPQNDNSRPAPANPELVQGLLDAKADPNLPDGGGRTPLLFVLMMSNATGNPARGSRPTQAGTGAALLEILIRAGADVDGMGIASVKPSFPLYEAVAGGDLAATRLLLAHRARPNQVAGDAGETPLHRAVQDRNRALVELLLAHGADPGARNNTGLNPLELVNPKPAAARGAAAAPGFPVAGIPVPQRVPGAASTQPMVPGGYVIAVGSEPPAELERASAEELAGLLKARNASTPGSTNAPAKQD